MSCCNDALYRTDPPAPANVRAVRESDTRISVNWDAPAFKVQGYRIYYTKHPSNRDVNKWPEKSIG